MYNHDYFNESHYLACSARSGEGDSRCSRTSAMTAILNRSIFPTISERTIWRTIETTIETTMETPTSANRRGRLRERRRPKFDVDASFGGVNTLETGSFAFVLDLLSRALDGDECVLHGVERARRSRARAFPSTPYPCARLGCASAPAWTNIADPRDGGGRGGAIGVGEFLLGKRIRQIARQPQVEVQTLGALELL